MNVCVCVCVCVLVSVYRYVFKYASNLCKKGSQIIPDYIKNSKSLTEFKINIRNWKPE